MISSRHSDMEQMGLVKQAINIEEHRSDCYKARARNGRGAENTGLGTIKLCQSCWTRPAVLMADKSVPSTSASTTIDLS